MRVEQRIGRIDRYGQRSEAVAIYNFVTPGTVDAEIYERCLLRIGVFRQAFGGSEETHQLEVTICDLKLGVSASCRGSTCAVTDAPNSPDRRRVAAANFGRPRCSNTLTCRCAPVVESSLPSPCSLSFERKLTDEYRGRAW